MKEEEIIQVEKITPDKLISFIGSTPADNLQELPTAVTWKSNLAGSLVRGIFDYQSILETINQKVSVFGPWSAVAAWQSSILDTYINGPIKSLARIAAGAGRNPDLIGDMNGWIYKSYSRLLYTLTGFFIVNDKFDRTKAEKISSTKKGQEFLKYYMEEFGQLEYLYGNIGLTRLKAMKELLKCLLVLITETPFDNGVLPFARLNKDGSMAMSFDDYLEENRLRLENLYHENAFDIKEYSERSTGEKIGFSLYEFVEGSLIHCVRLRYYPLPEVFKPNGKIIYMVTPLINKPELFDLDPGKSVIEGMQKEGYQIYLIDHGNPGWEETELDLSFYAQTIHDKYLAMIAKKHPRNEIYIMAYCMGGTMIMPYLARRAEERLAAGKKMDIKKVVLMASPVKFDDQGSGHKAIRSFIRKHYDPFLMKELFGAVNIPPQVIDAGMNEVQPGVQYNVALGFYSLADKLAAIEDSAPFLYWLTHGTKFAVNAHIQWITNVFMGNQIYEGKFCLPSSNPEFDNKPVNMDMLRKAGVAILDYRGTRDRIAPCGSCVSAETWGQTGNGTVGAEEAHLNRVVEKNIGHIFVVSRRHLAAYLEDVCKFYQGY